MTSQLIFAIAQEKIFDLHESADRSRRAASAATASPPPLAPVVALRLAGADEGSELAELAALDSQKPLRGEVIVALVDGRLVAALSLQDGRVIADPMVATGHARALLAARAEQLNGGGKAHRRRRRRWALRLA